MMRRGAVWASLCLWVAIGCGSKETTPFSDAGAAADAVARDVGPADTGASSDAGVATDAAAPDAGPSDASGRPDADPADSAGIPDADAPDAAPTDAASEPDAAAPDASETADAAAPDAAAPDAGEAADAAEPEDASAADATTTPDAAEAEDAALDAGPRDASVDPADAAVDGGHLDAGTSTTADAGPGDAGPPIDAGFTTQVIIDESGASVTITNGPVGDPAAVGCADGQREGLVDDSVFPDIAACLGTWTGAESLRGTVTSTVPCGDDAVVCDGPVDLCAPGWHVCGSSGTLAELYRLTAVQCEDAGGGRYVFGVSHCLTQSGCVSDPQPGASYPCFPRGWCSEPVCCGASCRGFGVCRDGVWPAQTHIAVGTDQGCAAITSRRAGGVLCCR